MSAAVFLDRDGVINRAFVRDGLPYPAPSVAETEILPGVAEAMAALRQAGFRLVVVTNQPDVARGTLERARVEEIHAWLAQRLPIDEFRTCFHDSADHCDCRKPDPGALLAAAREHDLQLADSWMIGDRWRDTEAGRRAGCKVIFIDYGYAEKQPSDFDHRAHSLAEAARFILGNL